MKFLLHEVDVTVTFTIELYCNEKNLMKSNIFSAEFTEVLAARFAPNMNVLNHFQMQPKFF